MLHNVQFFGIPTDDFDPLDFNPLAWYDSRNTNVVTTTTTAIDLGSFGHDLANPLAGNQPSLNASDVNFNGEDSYTFDGISDYLSKNVANYGSGLTGGETHIVINPVSTKYAVGLSIADTGSNADFLATMGPGTNRYTHIKSVTGENDAIKDSLNTNLSNQGTTLISVVYTGSAYRIFLDGNEMTLGFVSGGDNGYFTSVLSNIDNISIGAILRLTKAYGSFKWAASGIFPVLSDADRVVLMTGLKARYGII